MQANCTKQLALNYAASKAYLVKSSYQSKGYDHIPRGAYESIIKEAESRFSLVEGS
jgi:hypothetical protein